MAQEIEIPEQSDGPKEVLHLTINGKSFDWKVQYISGIEVRKISQIPKEEKLYLAIKRPWEDEVVENDTQVDLARPGIEHFFSVKPGEERLVTIIINKDEKKITRGKHTGLEIKKVGKIDSSFILHEIINGKAVRIENETIVLIKGGEVFKSHEPEGSSS